MARQIGLLCLAAAICLASGEARVGGQVGPNPNPTNEVPIENGQRCQDAERGFSIDLKADGDCGQPQDPLTVGPRWEEDGIFPTGNSCPNTCKGSGGTAWDPAKCVPTSDPKKCDGSPGDPKPMEGKREVETWKYQCTAPLHGWGKRTNPDGSFVTKKEGRKVFYSWAFSCGPGGCKKVFTPDGKVQVKVCAENES